MPSTATKAARMTKKDMEKYRRLLEEKKAAPLGRAREDPQRRGRDDRRVHPGHRRQGGLLVHPRVPLLADRRRALDAAPDRRCHRPHRRRHVRPLHQLRLPMTEKRLNAVPWAPYCLDCQELAEKGMLPN